jgi:serine/threonine-protein kinase
MEPSIAAYQRTLSLEPGFTWAHNELGEAYLREASRAIRLGQEVTPLLEKAVRQYERALELDSGFALPVGGLLEASTIRLEVEIAQKREAPEAHQAFSRAVVRLEQLGSSPQVVALWKARALRLRAHHELVLGRDPRSSLELAIEVIRAAAGVPPEDAWLLAEWFLICLVEAERERRQGREPALGQARTALRKVSEWDRWRAQVLCKEALQMSPLLARECQRLPSARPAPLPGNFKSPPP